MHQSFSYLDLDSTTQGIGVDYNLLETSEALGQVSLEQARTDIEIGRASGDIDTLRFGLTFPLSGPTSSTLFNSTARAS